MNKVEIDKIKKQLSKNLEEYIISIVEKYGKYIPKERKEMLENITNFEEILNIKSYGSINGYATDEEIYLPLDAENVLRKMNMIPGSGINKKHKIYNNTNLIINNNTFLDYIKHVFISGKTTIGYYIDLLLHETMHFCGSGGASALKEGLNELLTRKIALEKGFITSACGYPKEVQVVYKLENIFGEEITNQLAFINELSKEYSFLVNTLGESAAELYRQVYVTMDNEFYDKYYKYMDTYNGITGILKKHFNYKKIDYSKVYELINNYKKEQPTNKISNNITERQKLINTLKEEKEKYESIINYGDNKSSFVNIGKKR